MYGHDTLFIYFSRRAQQEQVAAINAGSRAAATAHRHLSTLHALKALLAFSSKDAPAAVASSTTAVETPGPCC